MENKVDVEHIKNIIYKELYRKFGNSRLTNDDEEVEHLRSAVSFALDKVNYEIIKESIDISLDKETGIVNIKFELPVIGE